MEILIQIGLHPGQNGIEGAVIQERGYSGRTAEMPK